METDEFNKWIEAAENLSIEQREIAERILRGESQFDTEQEIPAVLTDAVADCCRHCGCENIMKWGFSSGLQRWSCKECKKTFNILTNTSLAGLREKHKWIDNAQAMMDGLTLEKTAERCGNHITTAFRRRHRFAKMLGKAQCTDFEGFTEADITYFFESQQGSRSLNRKPRKRGRDKIPKGAGPHLVSVITLIDRYGHGAERIAPTAVRDHAYDLFTTHLDKEAILFTDGDLQLGAAVKDMNKAADQRNKQKHQALVGSEKSRGKKGDPVHIQTVNSEHSHLKRWMIRFYGVATKYLANYVGWFRHLSENHHQNDPNLFIGLCFQPTVIDKQLIIID